MSTYVPGSAAAADPVNGSPPGGGRRVAGVPRRRRLPYLLLGVLLVVGCSAGGVVVATQLGHRQEVLALARPVTVGQQLSARDLREVSVSTGTGLAVVPAASKATVEGRPVAYSLPAGALLTGDLLGNARVPPTGQAVAAVGLKAGQFPPELQAGNRVTVVIAPTPGAGTDTPSTSTAAWQAVVTGVRTDDAAQTTVVSLQMAQADARALAAQSAGQVSVVVVPGGGR